MVKVGGAVSNFAIDALVLDAVTAVVGELAFYLIGGITAEDSVGEDKAAVITTEHSATIVRSGVLLKHAVCNS